MGKKIGQKTLAIPSRGWKCPIISSRGNHPRGKLCAMMIYPREDEYLREDLEAIFDEFMEIVSSCPSSFIVHWAWNRGVKCTTKRQYTINLNLVPVTTKDKNREWSHSASYGLRAVKTLAYNILTDNRHLVLSPVRGSLLSGS